MDHLKEQCSETFGQDLLDSQPKMRHVRVLRCYHTCKDIDTALAMCTTGFADLAGRDEGYFCRGFYLSPDLGYSAEHYHIKESGTATVLCCDVVVGGAYHTFFCLIMCQFSNRNIQYRIIQYRTKAIHSCFELLHPPSCILHTLTSAHQFRAASCVLTYT
jgi:hypothetical protein